MPTKLALAFYIGDLVIKDRAGEGLLTVRSIDDLMTEIEHIVARSEPHNSGLCAADTDTKDEFASDLINLTLDSPSITRHQKLDKMTPGGTRN